MGCSSGKRSEESETKENKNLNSAGVFSSQMINDIIKAKKEKWIKDKESLLKKIFEIIERNKGEDGEISKLRVVYSSTIKQQKDKYSVPDLFYSKKFSFIKDKKDINWNRKPFSKIQQEVEDHFIANPDLAKYDGFNFSTINQVLQYESTDLELILAKTNNFETVPIPVCMDDVVIVIFFSYKEYQPSQKIKDLNNYLVENPLLRDKVRIIPVLNETAYSKEDAKNKEEIINLLGFKSFNINTYVLTEKDEYLKELLSWENEQSSICLAYDKHGIIRNKGMPSSIFADDIKYYLDLIEYQKKNFSDDKKVLLQENNFAGLKANSLESAIFYDLWMKKDKIFSAFDKIDTVYYQPPHLDCSYTSKLGPAKEELIKSLCTKVSNICFTFSKPITGKEIQSTINSELMKMKERNAWATSQKYTINYNITFLLHRNYYFGKTKEQEISLNYFLNDENSLDLENLVKDLNFLKAYPQLPKFGPISYQGEIGQPIPNLLSLHDENDVEDILDLSDVTKPKAIFIVSVQTDDKEKFDNYKQLFWENIEKFIGTDGRYDLYIIYRGDSAENAIEIKDHPMFLQKIFYFKFSNHDSDLRINADKPYDYLVMLLNKNNELQYSGDLVDLDVSLSLTRLLHGKPLVYKENNKINQANFSDFKQKLAFLSNGLNKHFDNDGFLYKPYFEFKYTHQTEMVDQKEVSSNYFSFFLKFILKDISKHILDKPDVVYFLKYFKNEFLGILTTEFIETIAINDMGKCSFCDNTFNSLVPHFYDQETNSYMCLKCENTKNNAELGIFHPTNLIYLRYEYSIILKEVIKKYFEENKASLNYLEGLKDLNYAECSICGVPISSQKIVWYSLTHIHDNKNNSLPVLLCESFCFPILSKRESVKDLSFNEKHINNMRMNCIDFKNLLYKKVILQDTSMF